MIQNQTKLSTSDHMTFLLLDYMTKSAVFTRPWTTCQSVITFQRRKFQKHDYKIDQSIEFSQSTTYTITQRCGFYLQVGRIISLSFSSVFPDSKIKSPSPRHRVTYSIHTHVVWSKANFSCQVMGSYGWYSMEKSTGDLLLGLKFVRLEILSTLLIDFLYENLGELRSRSL